MEFFNGKRHNLRGNARQTPAKSFDSLQFIDDCNSIVHGNIKDMDRALQQAALEFKLKWDRSKHWKNLGVNIDRKNTRSSGKRKRTGRFNLPDG